ncbi:MAG: Uroporphyrinogen synthase [Bryobacterales bacterium]|nr:Uroporphyrinogen synthase [Bryobacterales bacterium]
MAALITNQKGDPFVAPSMREVPLERNEEAFAFAEKLFAGQFDMVILLTGVGTRFLDKVLATRYPPDRFAAALRTVPIVARGPKPMSALRELQVPGAIMAPEPNTWREILAVTEGRPERRIAVQEYGRPNPELLDALRARGCEVTRVPVYQWELPADTAPLREAARRLAGRLFDVTLFTTSVQVPHLMQIAGEQGIADQVRAGLLETVVSSIGPTTTEALEELGIRPDMEPSHPKMGNLVLETAQRAADLLRTKRAQ